MPDCGCRCGYSSERCGEISCIPKCCIRFYLTRWLPAIDRDARWTQSYGARIDEAGLPGYVPCPSCLDSKQFVEPLGCWRQANGVVHRMPRTMFFALLKTPTVTKNTVVTSAR